MTTTKLPDHTAFDSVDAQNVWKQWEHGIIDADRCREKLREYGVTIDGDVYREMLVYEADTVEVK